MHSCLMGNSIIPIAVHVPTGLQSSTGRTTSLHKVDFSTFIEAYVVGRLTGNNGW